MSLVDVSTSLASKLAGANLSDDEANLLVTLLEGEAAEVEGFLDKSSPKLTEFSLGKPARIEQQKPDRWIDVLSTDWIIIQS